LISRTAVIRWVILKKRVPAAGALALLLDTVAAVRYSWQGKGDSLESIYGIYSI